MLCWLGRCSTATSRSDCGFGEWVYWPPQDIMSHLNFLKTRSSSGCGGGLLGSVSLGYNTVSEECFLNQVLLFCLINLISIYYLSYVNINNKNTYVKSGLSSRSGGLPDSIGHWQRGAVR